MLNDLVFIIQAPNPDLNLLSSTAVGYYNAHGNTTIDLSTLSQVLSFSRAVREEGPTPTTGS